ncbi:MAG TPA: HAMP domain-containing sensor histidine kinase [Ktedonobacterales bacterium]|nr:HAMP domain-containing sensor histidine kinase [Ktedonobacterales bacterium]
MIEPAPAVTSGSEREIYRDYERRRRLQLARILLPIFALVQGAVFVVSVVFVFEVHYGSPIAQIFIFNTALVGVDALLHALGLRFVRQGRVGPATIFVILPIGLTVIVPLLVYIAFGQSGNSPIVAITLGEMVATLVLIVLSGVMATSRWVVLATTLLMNVYTVFILSNMLQLASTGVALRSQRLLLLSFPPLVQWAVAGILFAASGTYLATLRELGDVRVAYARAQQLDQLKDQFIAHVNHELRSPVMALQGHIELLLLAEQTLTPEERHTYLQRAKRAGDGLVALVTSVLAVRRIEQEAGALELSAVAVRDVLESAIQLLDPREANHVERELRVNLPEGLEVWAEPVRVRQILTNLLSNALKYSPPGTSVDVSAELVAAALPSGMKRWGREAAAPRPMVEISVRDYGLGIPPDQIPLLFNRFVRLPRDLASSVPGNGLGLYLCQAFAKAMGGSIRIESTGVEGEGTIFHLRLPAPPPTPHAPSTIKRLTPRLATARSGTTQRPNGQ